MIDSILAVWASVVVRIIGPERCGIAIAECYYGKDGRFMVYSAVRLAAEDDDESVPPGLDPGIWNDAIRGQ